MMKSNLLRGSVLLATILLFAGCGKPDAPPEPMRSVLTQIVGAVAENVSATYAGEVRSRFETPLGFRIPGKVAARLVDVGARVKSGDILMRLDPSDTALTVAAATAKLNLAEADLERYRELRAKNFVSQAVLDAKETAYTATKAEADLAANQSAYTVLHADQNGVIAQVLAEVGQVVAAGQAVVRLARTDALEVAFAVPEARAQAVRSLKVAEVSLWADGSRRYPAALRELSAVADPLTRTYAARVSILEPDEHVMLGMTANVTFPGETGGVGASGTASRIQVPLTAIFQQEGKPALWVVAPDQTIALRPVKVASFGEVTAVLESGVAVGERIVVAGVHKLSAGEKIKAVDQLPKAPLVP